MAFEDGYYYGQCRIVGEATKTTDNGKHLSVTDGKGGNWSAQITNNSASVLVPGRAQYTVSLVSGSVVEWTGKVECGYGECIKVILADGYEPVIQKEFDDLKDQLTAEVGSTKVPFEFAYDAASGNFGYKVGADTFIPFKVGGGDSFKINGRDVNVRGLKARPKIESIFWWYYDGRQNMTVMVNSGDAAFYGIKAYEPASMPFTNIGLQIYDDGFSFRVPTDYSVAYVFVAVSY